MKTTKKIICILLAIVMIAIPTLTCVASASDKDNREYPTIKVWGFMAGDIYAEKNNEDSDTLWPISADFILGKVKEMLPAIAEFALTRDYEKFGEATTPVLEEMLGTAILDTNGEASDGSGVAFEYPAADTIDRTSILTFRYDWRLDPMVVAEELNDYIEYVCAAAGTDQVCLMCHSLGGVMTLTYITLYGDARIHSIMLNSTAIYGETYNGELMTGQIEVNGEALSEFLQYVMDGNEYEKLVDGLLEMLENAHILDLIASAGNDLVSNMAEYWMSTVVAPLFAYWPSIWAMVPDEYLEDAKNYIFNEVLAGNGVDYSSLIAKIDSMNVVRENREANLLKLNEDANLYVFSRYGYCSIPVTPSWDTNSDGVVDTKNTSFGATVTTYGTTFSDEYLAEADPDYISPDKTVDASTAMFPEQTWYLKGLGHSSHPDCVEDYFYTLLHYDGQATVDTFSQYPRFMKYDYATDTINPDYTEETVELQGFAKIIAKIKEFFETLQEMFRKLFKTC